MRNLALPRDLAPALARHCAEEYANLATLLPELYRNFAREVDRKFLQNLRIRGVEFGYSRRMKRVTWTDERLDDLSGQMDVGFDRVDRDIRDLRGEMNTGFADLRGEINALRSLMLRVGGGVMASVVVTALLGGI